MGSQRRQHHYSSRSALAMPNSLLVLASVLALSSHDAQQDGKSIVGISVIGVPVASAFDIRRSSPSKPSPKSTLTNRKALFFVDDDENDSSSNGDGSSFFFMNDASGAAGNPTTSSVSTKNGINGFTPRPPSIPPPSRLFRMHNATPSSSASTGTSSALFERKAVVLSSTISGNDPNMSTSGGSSGYSTSSTANSVDVLVDTISDALDQAKRVGSKFFHGMDVNMPHFGDSIRAIADDNADVVQPFLQMVGKAATKAAEIVAPAIEQMEEEAEEEMVVDVPSDTVDGAIFATLVATQVTAHSPILTAMAGCLAVYAVKSPGLGGDVARLVGSATISVGYFGAVVAQSMVNSAISSLPDPIEDGIVSLSKTVGGTVSAARDEMKESEFIQKVVAEAIPTAQSQLYLALEAIGKALADSAKSNKQYLLAPANVVKNYEANSVEVESLPETDLLTAASATSADAILQAVTEEEQARTVVEHTIAEETDRRWEVLSEKKEIKVETEANSFQRDLLERQLSQPHLASTSEAERTQRLLNTRRQMLEFSVAEQKRSLDRLEASLATSVDNATPFQQSLLSRQLSDSKAKSKEASVASIETERSDRLKVMRRQMLEISVAERNRSLNRIKMNEKRHNFAKIEAFAQQAVDAAAKASQDAQRAMKSGMTLMDIETANTNMLLSNLQLIRHKPSDDVEEIPADAEDDSIDNKTTNHESKRARAKKVLKRLMPL